MHTPAFKTAKLSTRAVNSLKHKCIHEAGHVLTALACRHRIDGVNVQPVLPSVSSDTTFMDTDYWQLSVACCCLGGPSASRLYFSVTLDDVRKNMETQTQKDFNDATETLQKVPGSQLYTVTRMFNDCERLSYNFLQDHAGLLQYLGDRLYKHRYIPADDFMGMSFMVGREIEDLTPKLDWLAKEYRIENQPKKGVREMWTSLHRILSRL